MYGEQIKKRVNSQHGDNYSKKNRKNTTTLTSMLVRPLYTVLLLTSIIVVSRAAVLFEDESSFWNYDEANILTLHSPTIKSSKGYNEGLWQKKTSQGKMSQLLGGNEGELDQTTAKEATTTTASLNDMLMKKAQLRHKNGEDNLRKSTTSARRSNNESSDSHNQPKHNPHFTDGTTDAHHHLDAHRNTNTSTNENNNDIHKWKRRKLEEDEEDEEDEEEEEEEKTFEDYFANNKYGFNDYSLRYATCQKVQRFNSAAIQNGANSAMTFNDIVLLRMCPKRRCSSGSGQTGTYGCSTGYGEYVIELEEYVDVYLRYQYDKMRNLCSFCTDCGYYNGRKRRRRHRTRRMDENVDDGGDDFYAYVDDDNADDGNADDGNADDGNTDDGNANAYYQPEDDDYYISAECINYNDECSNAADQCGTGYYQDDDDRDDEEKNQYLNLLNYVGCKQIEQDEDGDDDGDGDGMYLNPYCDPESGTIIMGIFYDSYCSEYAGDSIDVSNYVGVNFDNDLFSNAYSQECLECTQSVSCYLFKCFIKGILDTAICKTKFNAYAIITKLSYIILLCAPCFFISYLMFSYDRMKRLILIPTIITVTMSTRIVGSATITLRMIWRRMMMLL